MTADQRPGREPFVWPSERGGIAPITQLNNYEVLLNVALDHAIGVKTLTDEGRSQFQKFVAIPALRDAGNGNFGPNTSEHDGSIFIEAAYKVLDRRTADTAPQGSAPDYQQFRTGVRMVLDLPDKPVPDIHYAEALKPIDYSKMVGRERMAEGIAARFYASALDGRPGVADQAEFMVEGEGQDKGYMVEMSFEDVARREILTHQSAFNVDRVGTSLAPENYLSPMQIHVSSEQLRPELAESVRLTKMAADIECGNCSNESKLRLEAFIQAT